MTSGKCIKATQSKNISKSLRTSAINLSLRCVLITSLIYFATVLRSPIFYLDGVTLLATFCQFSRAPVCLTFGIDVMRRPNSLNSNDFVPATWDEDRPFLSSDCFRGISRCIRSTLWWTNIAMENGHLEWIYPLKMVIFHCYVGSPEGIRSIRSIRSRCADWSPWVVTIHHFAGPGEPRSPRWFDRRACTHDASQT